MPLFNWNVTWNYTYSPLKLFFFISFPKLSILVQLKDGKRLSGASEENQILPESITNKPASNTLLDQDIFHGEPDEWSPVPIEYSIRPYASEIRSMVPSYQEFVQDCKQRDTHRFEDLKYSTSVNTVAENPGKSLKTDVYVPYKRTRANKVKETAEVVFRGATIFKVVISYSQCNNK